MGDCFPLAQNISIRIETCDGAVVKEIYCKTKPVLSDGNKKGNISTLDLQLNEEHHVLIELALPDIEKCSATSNYYTYAEITLNGLNVISKKVENIEVPVSIPRRSDPGEQTPCLVVDEQRNRIKTVQSLTKAAEMAKQGSLEEACAVIKSSQELIETSVSRDSLKNKSLMEDLSKAMDSLSDKDKYVNCGRSTVTTLVDSHSAQRSTSMHSSSYITPSRQKIHKDYVDSTNPLKPAIKKRTCISYKEYPPYYC